MNYESGKSHRFIAPGEKCRFAVVFDSAGTLLSTYRVAKDICNKTLLPGIETTTLTFSSPDRVLVVLPGTFKRYYGNER